RPLPFVDPDGLVRLSEDHTSLGYARMEPSPPNYRDWKRMATSFDSIEADNGDTGRPGGRWALASGTGSSVREWLVVCSGSWDARPQSAGRSPRAMSQPKPRTPSSSAIACGERALAATPTGRAGGRG